MSETDSSLKDINFLAEAASSETQELDEAAKIAQRKLDVLLSPDFRNYGIRYMNITEYQQVLRAKSAALAEVSMFREDQQGTYAGLSFKEWLKQSADRWYGQIHSDTDWGREGGANLGVEWYNDIVKILKAAKKEYHQEARINEEASDDSVRQGVMAIFRVKLSEYLTNRKKRESIHDPARNSEYNLEKIEEAQAESKQSKENLQYLADRTRQHVEVINQFLNNDTFLSHKENISKLALALSEEVKLSGTRPANYHVAVVFSSSVIRDFENKGIANFKGGNWTRLKNQELLGDDIMGAVVLIPDKKLLEEVKVLDLESGGLAHPIIDSHGFARWPKNK